MGTKKGMVRKTARKAYMKKSKAGSKVKNAGYGMKKAKSGLKKPSAGKKHAGLRALPKAVRNKMGYAKKGKGVKKARNSARMNRLEELGRIDAEKKNKNRMAEKRRVIRELNAKKGKKVHKAKSGSIKSMIKKASSFGKKKSGKYLRQDAKKGKVVKKAGYGMKKAKSGTKKGMVRKTARRAYTMKKGGSSRKCRMGCR